jgi:hypothetical protein
MDFNPMDLILDFNPYPMAIILNPMDFSGTWGTRFRGFDPIDEQWISRIYLSWINEDFLLGI